MGFTVHRLASWSAPPTRLAYGYRIPFCLSPGAIRSVHRSLDSFGPDIVHENNQIFDLSLMASAWARVRHTPVLLTIHTALVHQDTVPRLALAALDRLVVRPFLELSHAHLVTPDVFMRDYVSARYGLEPPRR